jgi:hypothetical protein
MRINYSIRSAAGLVVIFSSLWIVMAAGSVEAEDGAADFDYDIFLNGDTLSLWLDVSPIMTQPKLEDLLAGLDILISIEMEVEKPRRLFSSRTLVDEKAAMIITHRLTEDLYRIKVYNFAIREYEFENQLQLADFLADSLIFQVADSMAGESGIRLKLSITVKSYSPNVLGGDKSIGAAQLQAEKGPDREFFESILSEFFKLIGFGKTSYQIKSPVFNVDDLSPIDHNP